MKKRYLSIVLSSYIISFMSFAVDGLTDLKTALKRLNGNSPIIAQLNSSFADVHDEVHKGGEVTVLIHENKQGFQLTYSANELAKMTAEKQAKISNDDAPSPTLDAAYKLQAIDLHTSLTANVTLDLTLQKATLISEKANIYNDEEIRVLAFDLPMEMLISSKRTRQYVNDFSARYEVFIKEDGTPIKSELNFQGSGSAYIVLSVKAYGKTVKHYQVVKNRLVVAKSSSTQGSKSFFGDFERNEEKSIVVMNGQD